METCGRISAGSETHAEQRDESHYFGAYILPFHVTPLPERTFQVDVNIIAANTAAPSGRVNAYHGEIPIPTATRARA